MRSSKAGVKTPSKATNYIGKTTVENLAGRKPKLNKEPSAGYGPTRKTLQNSNAISECASEKK